MRKKIPDLGQDEDPVVGGVYKAPDGTLVQCVESHDCSGCYYDDSDICTDDCMIVICRGSRRNDGCDVKFVPCPATCDEAEAVEAKEATGAKMKEKIPELGTAEGSVIGGVYRATNGTLVKCVEAGDCRGCYYNPNMRGTMCLAVGCTGNKRKDGRDVKFVPCDEEDKAAAAEEEDKAVADAGETRHGIGDGGCADVGQLPVLPEKPELGKVYKTPEGAVVKCVEGSDCRECVFARKLNDRGFAVDCVVHALAHGTVACALSFRSDETGVKFVPFPSSACDVSNASGEESKTETGGKMRKKKKMVNADKQKTESKYGCTAVEQLPALSAEPEIGKVYRTAEGIVVKCVESNDCRDCVFCSVLNEKGIADDCNARCCNIVACASGPRQDKKDVKFVRVQDSRYEEEQYPVLPAEPELGKIYRLTDGRLVKCEEQPDGVAICESCALNECGCINTLCYAPDRKDCKTVFFPELRDAAGGAGSDVPAKDGGQPPLLPEEPEVGKVYRLDDGSLVECADTQGMPKRCIKCALFEFWSKCTKCGPEDRRDGRTVYMRKVQDAPAACSREEVAAGHADEAAVVADVMVKVRQQEERLGMLGYGSCDAVQKLAEARLSLGDMLADAVMKQGKGGAE